MTPDHAPQPPGGSEIILYRTADGQTRVECRFVDRTVWLTQALIAELFGQGRGGPGLLPDGAEQAALRGDGADLMKQLEDTARQVEKLKPAKAKKARGKARRKPPEEPR